MCSEEKPLKRRRLCGGLSRREVVLSSRNAGHNDLTARLWHKRAIAAVLTLPGAFDEAEEVEAKEPRIRSVRAVCRIAVMFHPSRCGEPSLNIHERAGGVRHDEVERQGAGLGFGIDVLERDRLLADVECRIGVTVGS